MKKNYFTFATICLILSSGFGQSIGDKGCNPNPSCFDSKYSAMDDFAGAGVPGGIPNITNVKKTLSPGGNIQSAITSGGPGVVLLNNGTYTVSSTIYMKDNVVLRGKSKGSVKLRVTIKASSGSKKDAIKFNGDVNNAGIEDLTIEYAGTTSNPIDRNSLIDGGWCGSCFQNDPNGNKNLYVRQIAIDGDNNWVDNVNIFKTGTDPIVIWSGANHNTVRNTFIDRCHNKGGGGNGYFDLRGDYNLVVGCTVKRIRHFAVQQGAKYNVVINNRFEVDVNFHNGDDGYNLIEKNTVYRPSWHGWGIFATGGAQYGHKKPGPNNYIVNNTTKDYTNNSTPFDDNNKIYTFTGYGSPSSTNWSMPKCGTFYAVNCSGGGGGSDAPIGKTIWLKASNGKYVVAEKGSPGAPLESDRGSLGGWEKFDVVDAGGGLIALKANANGKYVVVEKSVTDAPLEADRSSIGGWEKFTWIDRGSGKIALKASANGKYVQARLSIGDGPLQARSTTIQGWETFTWGITAKSAFDEPANQMKIKIYPNPVINGIAKIEGLSLNKNYQLIITNSIGQMVYIEQISGHETYKFPVDEFVKSGMYIISIKSKNDIEAHKIFVQ